MRPDWDRYTLDICRCVAARSLDPNTQVGCVIATQQHEVRATGYNSLPRGVQHLPERLERPEKYNWMAHAEANAIASAARQVLEGSTAYVEIMPCVNCTHLLIGAGIHEVVLSEERNSQWKSEQYRDQHQKVLDMMIEAGLKVRVT